MRKGLGFFIVRKGGGGGGVVEESNGLDSSCWNTGFSLDGSLLFGVMVQ